MSFGIRGPTRMSASRLARVNIRQHAGSLTSHYTGLQIMVLNQEIFNLVRETIKRKLEGRGSLVVGV